MHPRFQREALKVHMELSYREQTLMTLHKIIPQEVAEDRAARRSVRGWFRWVRRVLCVVCWRWVRLGKFSSKLCCLLVTRPAVLC